MIMDNKFSRTACLIGKENLEKLNNCHIAIFGIGGVGSYVLEALLRSAVGNIDVYDSDTVDITNFNRQIIAVDNEIGNDKVDAAIRRARQINKNININGYKMFYLPDNADSVDLSKYDFIIDAIDTVTSKIELAVRAEKIGAPIISVMGTGNKIDPTAIQVTDIYKTKNCPLARVMRRELKNRGVKGLLVVYSTETAKNIVVSENEGRHSPASAVFVPAAAGMTAAAEVIKKLCNLLK